MRRIFLHLLLMAVFFNTAIGLPLHEVEHWRGSAIDKLAIAGTPAADDGVAQTSSSEETALHAACAWCAAYAQAFAFAAPAHDTHQAVSLAQPPRNPRLAHPVAGPSHWLLFASRAPPRMQG